MSLLKISKRTTLMHGLALVASAAFLNNSCSNTEFAGGAKPLAKKDDAIVASNEMAGITARFVISSGTKVLNLQARFMPKPEIKDPKANYKVDLELVPNSVVSEPSGEFPAEQAAQIAKSNFSGTLEHVGNSNNLVINMETQGIISGGTPVPSQKITLTQSSPDFNWSKDEGPVTYFGNVSEPGISGSCLIEPSGEQPHGGVLAVVLTKPAPCDFKLPTVKVGFNQNKLTEVPIGSYWKQAAGVSHSFPLLEPAPRDVSGSVVGIDNGFILVAPGGKSYLLADAGRFKSSGRRADSIANDTSNSLGYGPTQLMQPSPGTKADNFATATVFPKGSVIAIYDDTPDMAGGIDVSALVDSATSSGITMSWSAVGAL